jgi:hypothetical protein
MGGAATWHLAAHYASLWAAASPGAGFVDTFVFQKVSRWPTQPSWYVQKLWHLYDVTDYAANLFNCPVVAYSGEIDPQREAAELMNRAMAGEGIELVHIIGPKTAHKFEPNAKEEVARRVDALMEKGRDPFPKKVRFTTWTLRYNNMAWITIDGLEQHWARARVDAEIISPELIHATTTNISALTFSSDHKYGVPASAGQPLRISKIVLDGQLLPAPSTHANGSFYAHFEKHNSRWRPVTDISTDHLQKRHGLFHHGPPHRQTHEQPNR